MYIDMFNDEWIYIDSTEIVYIIQFYTVEVVDKLDNTVFPRT